MSVVLVLQYPVEVACNCTTRRWHLLNKQNFCSITLMFSHFRLVGSRSPEVSMQTPQSLPDGTVLSATVISRQTVKRFSCCAIDIVASIRA